MSVHAVDSSFPQYLPSVLSRPEWELLFASVRVRLEQTVVAFPEGGEPAEAMSRIRADVMECAEALRKLQVLLAPARAGFRETQTE
jgi:hypothetical protein